MDLTTQLENNELRKVSATDGTVQYVLPGGQSFVVGEEYRAARIPKASIVTGFQAIAKKLSSDIVVSLGTPDNPLLFLDHETITSGNSVANDPTAAMQHYFPDGSDVVITIHSGGFDTPESEFVFSLFCTELETQLGKYTA